MNGVSGAEIDPSNQITIWKSFIPLIVLAGFLLVKVVLCKVRAPICILSIAACLVASAFGFESHFDNQTYNAPLFLTAIPILLLFVTLTVAQAYEVFGEGDACLKFFYSCDSKIKQAFTIFNLLVTLLFSLSFVGALFCMENLDEEGLCAVTTKRFSLNQKSIVDWAVFTILIYFCLMFEAVGRFVLDIIFEQFAVEMIDQQKLKLY